ncbi:MAG: Glutamate synthase [NADPH] small chain [Elusimicrobia bacterium]|nr:Glutamate synthase [NADPH] small chain [Elusimicrobiota bacterium]
MGDIRGFITIPKEDVGYRPVEERLKDWKEVTIPLKDEGVKAQGARCMDCGIPTCHWGCPVDNLIPDWNDLVYRGRWQDALERLLRTNNLPEMTGRVCPAPCEVSCVLGLIAPPVSIKLNEYSIIEKGFQEGWIKAHPPKTRTNKKVAVIGSGPAGLAAAQQLNSAGHWVTVFEKNDRIGGLLRYGIPDFKLEKRIVDRRQKLLEDEGITFRTNAHVGVNISIEKILEEFDALLLAGGSEKPRDLPVPGRDLNGIHFAMEFLPQQNKRVAGDKLPPEKEIKATGKHVIVIGGGDTGSDCIGTSHRQGAKSVTTLEVLPKPPLERPSDNPWPEWSRILRLSSSHKEGGEVQYSVLTKKFSGENGAVKKLQGVKIEWKKDDKGQMKMVDVPGSEFELPADLVLLAMGFVHPVHEGMIQQLGVNLDPRGNVMVDSNNMTSKEGVFAAGDMAIGQSLVVRAIKQGRNAARGIDKYLMGETQLP